MVHRWRKTNGAATAYFVSRGTLPGRVYGDLTDTMVPIEINPEAWLLYLATVCTDDPAEQSKVAEMVAESAIRESFFGIAASYTVEDVMALSRRLTAVGGPATIEDSRAALQLDLLGLFGEADSDNPSNEQRVSAVVQRRQVRATTRLARGQADLDATITRVQQGADLKIAAERSRADAAERGARNETARANQSDRTATYWRRMAVGGTPAIAMFLVGLLLTINGAVPVVGSLVLLGGLLVYASLLHGFAVDPDAKTGPFVTKALADLGGIMLVEFGVGLLL
jgi:hypothetical protein